MEFAIRLFFRVFFVIIKRRWYIVLLPVVAMTIHGVYTASWYVWSSILFSLAVAIVMTFTELKRPW